MANKKKMLCLQKALTHTQFEKGRSASLCHLKTNPALSVRTAVKSSGKHRSKKVTIVTCKYWAD